MVKKTIESYKRKKLRAEKELVSRLNGNNFALFDSYSLTGMLFGIAAGLIVVIFLSRVIFGSAHSFADFDVLHSPTSSALGYLAGLFYMPIVGGGVIGALIGRFVEGRLHGKN